MLVLLYHLFLVLFRVTIWIASPFHLKARQWLRGRRGVMHYLRQNIAANDKVIWMHCASLGEFEQGRPLLETIRSHYPTYRILLTFFSPSGYEVQKSYPGADWVCYLPLDGPRTAREFLDLTHPELVIFVKYEFWFFYLKKIFYQKIPLLLVSALFRENMNFFRWYGALSRKMLGRFQHVFVQNESSLQLLEPLGIRPISSVAGDTRFDRVLTIADRSLPIEGIDTFLEGRPVLVAGSTWPADERTIHEALSDPSLAPLKLIIAPHELSAAHLRALHLLFKDAIHYSQWNKEKTDARVLIMDNYGMLSRLYRHGTMAYVGGGLHKAGIHNTLEAAVYSIPVIVGPYHQKHAEATDLIRRGGAFTFTEDQSATALKKILCDLLHQTEQCKIAGQIAGQYVKENAGATQRILDYIQEKRLLIN